MDCLFCKIAQGEIATDFVYEDDEVLAFNDISPMAPIHQLIIPKRHISTTNDFTMEDKALIGQLTLVGQQLAKEQGIAEEGYRLVLNCNRGAGQSVFHVHLHLLGGRQMTWPPG